LLVRRGFAAFFVTQLLSAFNDNFFKNAVVIWISATQARMFGLSPEVMISLCSGVFILPFFAFSATAGQLADRHGKTGLIRLIKLAEIAIMALCALGFFSASLPVLIAGVFLMGVHSAFLGPIKYAILPQLVPPDELVAGNALVEMGTFLAILAGTIGGGVLILGDHGNAMVAAAVIGCAALGYLASLRMPVLPAVAPDLAVSLNPLRPTIEILRITARTRAVFLSALGISWFWFFGAALLTLLPTYARVTLSAHEHVVTLFLALFCAGIALGSLLCEKISGKNLELGLVPFGSFGMTLFALDLFFVGTPAHTPAAPLEVMEFLRTPHAPRVVADLFGIALFGGFYTVPLYTMIQQRAEPAERSRVVAGNNVLNALFMVVASALLAGLFALKLSVPHIFLIVALLNAVVAIYIDSLLPEFFLRFVAWILSRIMYRLTLSGHERIPEAGPCVLVCNHVSFIDWLIIGGSVRRPARFVMDHRIAKTPVLSFLFKQGKTIPIAPEREDKALMESAFAKIAEELRAGEVVCIFPEGKITKTGELNAFKSGVERIVRETPAPVVPMALSGLWGSLFSRKDGPALQKLPRRFRARLRLSIGEPLPASEVSAALLEQRVRALLAENAAADGAAQPAARAGAL
jgi:1-acyl-sn-glycerol-3-phosphate acyltransferase